MGTRLEQPAADFHFWIAVVCRIVDLGSVVVHHDPCLLELVTGNLPPVQAPWPPLGVNVSSAYWNRLNISGQSTSVELREILADAPWRPGQAQASH